MSYPQAYSAYRDTNIKTASQGKLIVLLYEEAVRQLSEALKQFNAKGAMDAPKIEKFNANVRKTQAVITELQVSLDMEKGGQIAQSLMSLYVYFNNELLDANINQNKAKIEFILKMMKELLESWRTAASSTANAPASDIPSALNIEG